MKRSKKQTTYRYSPRTALAALGLKIDALRLLDPVKQKVIVLQKSIRHTPSQKLMDAFIAILAGAHGLSEINTRVRSDEALQRAFGRKGCAEQSVVQETLNACTVLNIQQIQQAINIINRQYGAGSQRHLIARQLYVQRCGKARLRATPVISFAPALPAWSTPTRHEKEMNRSRLLKIVEGNGTSQAGSVYSTPSIVGSRSRLKTTFRKRGSTGLSFRVATIQPENSSTA